MCGCISFGSLPPVDAFALDALDKSPIMTVSSSRLVKLCRGGSRLWSESPRGAPTRYPQISTPPRTSTQISIDSKRRDAIRIPNHLSFTPMQEPSIIRSRNLGHRDENEIAFNICPRGLLHRITRRGAREPLAIGTTSTPGDGSAAFFTNRDGDGQASRWKT